MLYTVFWLVFLWFPPVVTLHQLGMTLSEPSGRTVHREAIGTNNFGKYKTKVILKGVCIISLHNYFKTVYLKSISETILAKLANAIYLEHD